MNQKHETHSDLMEDPAFWRRQAELSNSEGKKFEAEAALSFARVTAYLALAERLERGG